MLTARPAPSVVLHSLVSLVSNKLVMMGSSPTRNVPISEAAIDADMTPLDMDAGVVSDSIRDVRQAFAGFKAEASMLTEARSRRAPTFGRRSRRRHPPPV